MILHVWFFLFVPDIFTSNTSISDTRFSKFFEGPRYFSIIQNGQETKTVKTDLFKTDFNYDIVIQEALGNSTAIYARYGRQASNNEEQNYISTSIFVSLGTTYTVMKQMLM